MIQKTITIPVVPPYTVTIGQGLLHETEWFFSLRDLAHRWVIVTDSGTHAMGYHQIGCLAELPVIIFPSGEQYKTRETKSWIEDQLFLLGCGRDTGLIALGGGVVTDIVGFTAATFCRGIPVIYLPTTSMAMVDASIGGKTGVNTPQGKNLIGSTSHPCAIVSDINTILKSPTSVYEDGVFEVIKHALIYDCSLFDFLLRHVNAFRARDPQFIIDMIARSVEVKMNIVGMDPYDTLGSRALLNYGHTIGHALEVATDYQLSHGQAVGLGLCMESYISMRHGVLSNTDLIKIIQLIKIYGIRTDCLKLLSPGLVEDALFFDKKCRKGVVHSVFLEKIGQPLRQVSGEYLVPIETAWVINALEWLVHTCSA